MKGSATTLGLLLSLVLSGAMGCETSGESMQPQSAVPAAPPLTLVRLDAEDGARPDMGSYDAMSGRLSLSDQTMSEVAELAAAEDFVAPKVLLVIDGDSMVADDEGTATPQRLLKHGSVISTTLIDIETGKRVRFARIRVEQEGEMAHVEPPADLPPS